MSSEILAKVVRGQTVESVHRGHFIVLDGERNVIASAGDPETITYFRSSCKPLQAIPVITSGAADAFSFSDAEIAMACASHSGEPMHVRAAGQMLGKAGLAEPYLRCGSHLPFYEKEAERMLREKEWVTQLHNNCSGKHAAMLAYAKHIEADLTTYEQLDHPVQQSILETISAFTAIPKDEIALGVDGCAAPNFAVPLVAMAASFLRLMSPPDAFDDKAKSACSRIVSAMLEFPELIGGTERLDTMLMQTAPAKLISKVGADGVWLCGVLPNDQWETGLAIALKVEDGDDKRARPVVAVEILRQLRILSPDDLPDVSPMAIMNRRRDGVGHVVADFLM
ncbi:MAG TPA: asparaginase [Pyrinomonadaceae bacterium]|nr:asparaginase [Pyrinomonadaceae bacterium]